MARSVEEIQNQIQEFLVGNFASVGIMLDTASWSKRNVLRLLCFTTSSAINYFEQLMDVYKGQLENIATYAAAGSRAWVQQKMFEFQYSSTNPQYIQVINNALGYAVIDPSLCIITACSVRVNVSNVVQIKVAKGNPFAKLTDLELFAAQSYAQEIGTAGITYSVGSSDADKLYIKADVFYKGQFASVIQANVILALNNFLQTLSVDNFDGSIKISDLEGVIRNVQGVQDVLLVDVRARADIAAFADGTDLVLGQQVIARLWNSIAGYVIQETTPGATFADTLNFIAQ